MALAGGGEKAVPACGREAIRGAGEATPKKCDSIANANAAMRKAADKGELVNR
jgi:hypothetical protein